MTGSRMNQPGAVRRITGVQISAMIAIGVLASLIVLVQPVVLAPLAAEGRLTLKEMGQAAMFESLGMAIAVALSGLLLRPRNLKLIVAVAALASVIANWVSATGSHEVIALARLFNGLTIGMVLWVWTGMLTNIELPARYLAIFLALQSAAGLLLSTLLPGFVVARWGGSGAYAIMAGLSLLNIFIAFLLPSAYPENEEAAQQRLKLPSLRGMAGLVAVMFHLAAVMALWIYIVPLGQQMGLSKSFVDLTVSIALGAQIFGGLAGAVCARMNAKLALYISVAASLVGLGMIGADMSSAFFLTGLALIAFFLIFAPGFQMPYLLEVDPGRGAGMQLISAQQLGFSAGPALTALMIHDGIVTPALFVSGVLYVGTAALVFVTTAFRRRSVASNPGHHPGS